MHLNGEVISEEQAKREFKLRADAINSEQYKSLANWLFKRRNNSLKIDVIMSKMDKGKKQVIAMIAYLRKKGFDIENKANCNAGEPANYRMIGFTKDSMSFISANGKGRKRPFEYPKLNPLIESVFR